MIGSWIGSDWPFPDFQHQNNIRLIYIYVHAYFFRPFVAFPGMRHVPGKVPSDVIVDASMAAAVRDAGRMWTKVGTSLRNKEVDS